MYLMRVEMRRERKRGSSPWAGVFLKTDELEGRGGSFYTQLMGVAKEMGNPLFQNRSCLVAIKGPPNPLKVSSSPTFHQSPPHLYYNLGMIFCK